MSIKEEVKKTLNVPLNFHWSVLLLPALMFFSIGWPTFIFFPLLIISLLFHEYAHVWMAIRSNIRAFRVEVIALGAMAVIDANEFIKHPKKEFKCAIAGPLASLLLSLVFLCISFFLTPRTLPFDLITGLSGVNFLMFLFNILPIYPSDGGRMLNSILASWIGIEKGIKISSVVSYILCGLGIIFSIYIGLYWFVLLFVLLIVFCFRQRRAVLMRYNINRVKYI